MRKFALATALILGAGGVLAADGGTPDEAKAMLEGAAAALEQDQAAALAAFTAGEAPFKEKDLYVFCGGEDGLFSAHGANADLVGVSMRDLMDKSGEPVGATFYGSAAEGQYEVVNYMWPKPGETEASQKSSYVTKVADQVCGVGYYE